MHIAELSYCNHGLSRLNRDKPQILDDYSIGLILWVLGESNLSIGLSVRLVAYRATPRGLSRLNRDKPRCEQP